MCVRAGGEGGEKWEAVSRALTMCYKRGSYTLHRSPGWGGGRDYAPTPTSRQASWGTEWMVSCPATWKGQQSWAGPQAVQHSSPLSADQWPSDAKVGSSYWPENVKSSFQGGSLLLPLQPTSGWEGQLRRTPAVNLSDWPGTPEEKRRLEEAGRF